MHVTLMLEPIFHSFSSLYCSYSTSMQENTIRIHI